MHCNLKPVLPQDLFGFKIYLNSFIYPFNHIPASSLRHYDRELLTAGIPLATEEEVFLRLEDFGS